MGDPHDVDVTQEGTCLRCGRVARLDEETGVWPDRLPRGLAAWAEATNPDAPWVCSECAVAWKEG